MSAIKPNPFLSTFGEFVLTLVQDVGPPEQNDVW